MEEKKNFEFRKLKPCDLFLMTTIISKIGVKEVSQSFKNESIKEAINKLISKNENSENVDSNKDITLQVGIEVAFEIADIILKNISKCEKEIYQMLANVSEKAPEEIRDLDIAVFTEMLVEFVRKDEFKDFFKVASKFIK